MRLLIAGWHGQVARALMEAAPAAADIKALAVGRAALDLHDPRSIERAMSDLDPTIVINSAAYTAVDQAEQESERAFALNAEGATLLARATARRNVPLIHLSTHYVFDGTKPGPYAEDDTPCPATVYGRSKLAGEHAVAKENPQHILLRTSWVFSSRKNSFAARVVEAARRGETLRMVDDQHGNPTYAPHLADAILDIAREISVRGASTPWGIYHAAATGSATWYDLASALARSIDPGPKPGPAIEPIRSADYPAKAPRPANSELSSNKLERTFNISLPSWQTGVAACLAELTASQP